MFQIVLIFTIAISVGLGTPSHRTVSVGTNEAPADTPADTPKDDWQPEPQVRTGKFTTAIEVKPILTATKANWAALREYDGNDLLYLTNLLAWRCGLHEIRYAVNGAPQQIWEMEECHTDTAQPNAMKMETVLPFTSFVSGSVSSVSVTVIYDDGTEDSVTYQRADILMP
ncbi:MAG: hypothetical protein KAT26_11680 [Marinosulfonomonas sp.]|nr:hypothetical protein [Marinosulfonomonas sp.]